jgi:phage terminase small subunit
VTALANPRHERFAQELAKGKTAEESYALAGFSPNRGNASVLKHKQNILERVSEILDERESIHAQATADAIKSTALTKAWVIETLMENVAKAMQAKAMTNEEGETIGEFQYQGSVANKALELLGKEIGMFVDRSINENVNTNYVVSGEPVDNVEDWEREHAPKH